MKQFRFSLFFALIFLPARHAQQNDPCRFTEDSRTLAENGEFHSALRSLTEDLTKWDRCIATSGNTNEGARSFLRTRVLDLVSRNGDAEWGAILDDAQIPYRVKTDMLFEILEDRLGKGAVYLGNEENIIVPRSRPANLEREMIRLPEK
jgi:hypothetical protein